MKYFIKIVSINLLILGLPLQPQSQTASLLKQQRDALDHAIDQRLAFLDWQRKIVQGPTVGGNQLQALLNQPKLNTIPVALSEAINKDMHTVVLGMEAANQAHSWEYAQFVDVQEQFWMAMADDNIHTLIKAHRALSRLNRLARLVPLTSKELVLDDMIAKRKDWNKCLDLDKEMDDELDRATQSKAEFNELYAQAYEAVNNR